MKDILAVVCLLTGAFFGVALLMNLHDNCEHNRYMRSVEQETLEKWEIYFRNQHNQHN